MPRLPKPVAAALSVAALVVFLTAGGYDSTAAPAPGAFPPAWAGKMDPFLRQVALGSRRTEGTFSGALPPGSAAILRALPPFVRAERAAARPGGAAEAVLYLKVGLLGRS